MAKVKHGKSKSRLYGCWHDMKQRCSNPSRTNHKHYKNKGIIVCEEWRNDFQAFHDWAMANGYADNLTLDRIDNNGNYEPSNCRWATPKEQENNRSNNVYLTINGETKPLAQWATENGLKYCTVEKRYLRGKRGADLIKPVTAKKDGEQ